MANPEELLLATFQLDMSSNQCGYPLCCPGTQVDSKSNTELRSYNISTVDSGNSKLGFVTNFVY